MLLLVTGAVALYAAFRLVLDEFDKYEHPKKVLSCDLNPFINCSDVMTSAQGHLFDRPLDRDVFGALLLSRHTYPLAEHPAARTVALQRRTDELPAARAAEA